MKMKKKKKKVDFFLKNKVTFHSLQFYQHYCQPYRLFKIDILKYIQNSTYKIL